jgi:glutathione synthase/RimK-type ligase-like ATP-grasp enzyme
MVIRRQRTDTTTHLNNTSQGAEASLVPIDELEPSIIENSRKICYTMGRDMAGIDVLVANDGSARYVFLEVNAVPQLTSGVFIDEKMQTLSGALLAAMKGKV